MRMLIASEASKHQGDGVSSIALSIEATYSISTTDIASEVRYGVVKLTIRKPLDFSVTD